MFYYPHMPIGKMWIYRLLFFVCLFVCMVTDFSTEDKSSGIEFCMAVIRRLRQGIPNFGALCSPRSPKSDESASRRTMSVPVGDSTACLLSSRGVLT